MRTKLLSSALLTVLLVGCAPNTDQRHVTGENAEMYGPVIADLSAEPVEFSLVGLKGDPVIRKRIYPSSQDIEEMIDASDRGDKCETPLSDARKQVLRNAYKNQMSITYVVIDTSPQTRGEVFTVWLLPNKGYEDQAMVEEDWNVCAVGAYIFKDINDDWVAFAMRSSMRDLINEPSVEDFMATVRLR